MLSPMPNMKSATYYFTQVTFLVEGTLFRVPRHHFEQQSEIFRDMLTLPIPTGTLPDGSSDQQPLRLEGVKKEDFQQLLRLMFPPHLFIAEVFSLRELTSLLRLLTLWQMDAVTKAVLEKMSRSTASREDWISVLDLSVERQLQEARALAISALSTTFDNQGIDKVLMARKYKVEQWLREGLSDLVGRSGPFSDAEEDQLGYKTIIKLHRVRELDFTRRLGHSRSKISSPTWAFSISSDITGSSDIRKEFQTELEEMEDEK